MNLKDILAISGEGTLFKFIAQGKNAIIVENLETGRRISAGGTSKVSALDEIAVYTSGEDMPLAKVMDRIWEKENGGEAISHKVPDGEMKKYFAEVLPEYDHDRVYTSDIKKVLHWYNILHKLNMLIKEEAEEVKTEEVAAQQTATEEGKDVKTTEKKKAQTAPEKKTAGKDQGQKKSGKK